MDGIFTLGLTISSFLAISFVSIIINSIITTNDSQGAIWLLCGFLLAIAVVGALVGIILSYFACIREEENEVLSETVKNRPLLAATISFLYLCVGAILVALSAIIVSDKDAVSEATYIYSAIVLSISSLALLIKIVFVICQCPCCTPTTTPDTTTMNPISPTSDAIAAAAPTGIIGTEPQNTARRGNGGGSESSPVNSESTLPTWVLEA